MTTIVFLHAHPDDEASQTSGSMARASAQGDRVVLVFATGGEHGEVPEDLGPQESLLDRRRAEAQASAQVLGVARVAWLGYLDSGMAGWSQNQHEGAFAAAHPDGAAARLAAVLDEEDADVLVGYDWHGGYGHPDHIAVHRTVHRAAELAARRPRVLEGSMNRDAMRRLMELGRSMGEDTGEFDPDRPMDDGNPFGTPESELQWQVDVTAYLPQRRASLEAHRSQTTDVGMMLSMPEPVFAAFFGTEHYLEPGLDQPMTPGWPFAAAGHSARSSE